MNKCGNRVTSKDPHLHGGAYLHANEVIFNALKLALDGYRRCDPGPHMHATSPPVNDEVIVTERDWIGLHAL